jgi:hypothetical protein
MALSMKPGRVAFVLVVLCLLSPLAAGAQAAAGAGAGAGSIDGTIVSITANVIVLTLADATQKTVTLKDGATILDRQVATADQIKPGDALGVAAKTDNGALVATSINIFAPQMWDVVRKGQFPMATGETMTNAMTAQVVANSTGHVLTMKLDMGNATITVPDGITIHRLVFVKADQLTPGLRVMVRATTDANGNLTASSVSYDQPART